MGGRRVFSRAPLGLALALLITACASPAPPRAPGPSAAEIRAENRANLSLLDLEMTKHEVLSTMGSGVVQTYRWEGGSAREYVKEWVVPNPYRSEATRAADGSEIEILFYYTDWRRGDGRITDDELTPLVLENGRLAGWGWPELRGTLERNLQSPRSYLWSYQCDLFRRCRRDPY